MIRVLQLRSRARLAVAAAVAAFALGGAGMVLAANVTPSPRAAQTATQHQSTSTTGGTSDTNNNFGAQVQKQIAACKAARPASGGKQGIGQCLSAWVTAHNPGHTGNHGAPSNTTGATHSGR